jgi:glycosyltransferase involved in cell wall biosynthesis
MILTIDASNIRAGGGITHLKNILNYADPERHDVTKVIVYGGQNPLKYLPKKSWLDLREIPLLNKSFLRRLHWQQTEIVKFANKSSDLLLFPGGFYIGSFRPYVAMFQNMQIFEAKERNRESGKEWFRLKMLQLAQCRTFQNASGLICPSEYALNYLTKYHPKLVHKKPLQLIPHGAVKLQETLACKEKISDLPLRILYVSTVKNYKHQWNLIDAVGCLRKEGTSIELHLVGGGDPKAICRMRKSIQRNDPEQKLIYYHGNLPQEETLEWYQKADIFVFPSTCETFGISLLEAMSAGLPIASSDRGPLPEVLKDAGLYFNPESVLSIKICLQHMIENPRLQQKLAIKAQQYSEQYSWKKCANETFSFLRDVYEENKK